MPSSEVRKEGESTIEKKPPTIQEKKGRIVFGVIKDEDKERSLDAVSGVLSGLAEPNHLHITKGVYFWKRGEQSIFFSPETPGCASFQQHWAQRRREGE